MEMSFYNGCPGAKLFKEVVPDYIHCPQCHTEVEIWSDEPYVRCPDRGGLVMHDAGVSCIDWCAFAAECIGVQKYERLQQGRKAMQGKKDSGGEG